MILPVCKYGHSILRIPCKDINQDYLNIDRLIDDMWQTLYTHEKMGLAAPQIYKSIKLFIIDSNQLFVKMKNSEREKYFENNTGIIETFINSKITYKSEQKWCYNEHCIGIPTIIEEVERPWSIEIEYYDRLFIKHKRKFDGITARVIQHEYDHTMGILYIDYLSPLMHNILKSKLNKIAESQI